MPKQVYDTRFFAEYFYSDYKEVQIRAKDFVIRNKGRYVSVVTIHEVYMLSLAREGREAARLRLQTIQDFFHIVEVDAQIAVMAAELRHKSRIPMADGLIAATCRSLDARCITDDPHLTSLKEVKTQWV